MNPVKLSPERGFTQVPNAVLLSDELTVHERMTYMLLRFHARGRDECSPSLLAVARQGAMSERTVRDCVSRLVDAGLLSVRRERGRTSVYCIARVGDAERLGVVQEMQDGGAGDAGLVVQEVHHPHSKKKKNKTAPVSGERSGASAAVFSVKQIDGRKVQAVEVEQAREVLGGFNDVFGTKFRADEFVKDIIRVIRKYPEVDVAGHRSLCEASRRSAWWERNGSSRPVTPRVVYGSVAQFERTMHDAERQVGRVPVDDPYAKFERFG